MRSGGGYILNAAERKRVIAETENEFDSLHVIMPTNSSHRDRTAAMQKYHMKPISFSWLVESICCGTASEVSIHAAPASR